MLSSTGSNSDLLEVKVCVSARAPTNALPECGVWGLGGKVAEVSCQEMLNLRCGDS